MHASPTAVRVATPPESGSSATTAQPRPSPSRLGRGLRFITLLAVVLAGAMVVHAALNWHDETYWGSTLSQWTIGLLVGVTLGWLTRVRWSDLPRRLTVWARLQRRNVVWGLWGLAAIVVLLFY